jgi:predicted short-subunit dehydrogenase-like oxidoreductase (DUF2520 family)
MKEGDYDIAIIGPGKVGTALGALYAARGGGVVAVGGRQKPKAEDAARKIGHGAKALGIYETAAAAPNVILSVNDDALPGLFADIAGHDSFARNAVVVHCSGILCGRDLTSDGGTCELGSLHPLQTFPTADAAIAKLPGSYCFYEGSEAAIRFMTAFARTTGMKPVKIGCEQKALYHASAAIASNFLVALLDAAITAGGQAGVPRETFWPALRPLIDATLDNVDRLGAASALTGPITRGDSGTVAKHLASIEHTCPELSRLYRELGVRAASIARERNSISAEQYATIVSLLEN